MPSNLYDIDIKLNSELFIKALMINTQLICKRERVRRELKYFAYYKSVERKIISFSKTDAPYFIVMGRYFYREVKYVM